MTVAKIDEEVFGTSGVLENIGRGIDDRFTIFLPGSAKGKRLSVIRLHHLGVDIIEAARELEARLTDIGGAAAGSLVEQANAGVDRISKRGMKMQIGRGACGERGWKYG